MTYFKNFPRTSYRFNTTGERKSAVNILQRFAFRSEIKDNVDLFVLYHMRDGESMQDIAHRLYGSSKFHWILYLLNDIENPNTDLPMTSLMLENYIKSKYEGYALFMNVNKEDSNIRAFEGNFVAGETITGYTSAISMGEEVLTEIGYTGEVVSWDARFRKLVVKNEEGETNLTFEDDTRIVGDTSGARATLKRRLEHRHAVHSFEDGFGNVVNPLPSPLSTEASALDGYVDQSENADIVTITNDEYEQRENDLKKQIKVLRIEYAQQIIRDAEKVFA